MAVGFVVDCRDEEINGASHWMSPEENLCGIMLYMDTVKIYLTSDQILNIMAEWKAVEAEVHNKMAEHILGHMEVTNETPKN